MDKGNRFYITTPIYYVNGRPHLGHLYTTVLADILTRWQRLCGKQVYFLTGTDEHGQKVAEAAQRAGMEPKAFVDSLVPPFQDLWKQYGITYTTFIRTTDPAHIKAVQDWILMLQKKGDIYKSEYKGWYCVPCETFVTEKDGGSTDGIVTCPDCRRPTRETSEESYFFKLSAYQDRLLEFYDKNPDCIVPSERRHEIINFIKGGLRDLSISRTSITWGIPFPGDSKHVVYVWADALNNYCTALGSDLNLWWPPDMQLMAKDIFRFHAVYWPAFLMASGLELPKQLLVHGWLLVNSQKMSKSFGNSIDPQQLLEQYGADQVRYYLARQALTQDSEFSTQDLELRVTSDLANDLGNLLNRVLILADKYQKRELTARIVSDQAAVDLRAQGEQMMHDYRADMDAGYCYRALATLWKFINQVNAYFHAQEPWKQARDTKDRFEDTLWTTVESLYRIAVLLSPVMPTKMAELLHSLGIDTIPGLSDLIKQDVNQKFTLTTGAQLFMKYVQPEAVQVKPEQIPSEQTTQQAPSGQTVSVQTTSGVITIDDFTKVILCVGTIAQAEDVTQSEKLIKLQVTFGDLGMRQILAGVRKYVTSAELIGKQGIFVLNLAPRKLAGVESQGMMLCASDAAGKPIMATVLEPVPDGTRLK